MHWNPPSTLEFLVWLIQHVESSGQGVKAKGLTTLTFHQLALVPVLMGSSLAHDNMSESLRTCCDTNY